MMTIPQPQAPYQQQQKKGSSKFTTFIVIITIVVMIFIVYKKIGNIGNMLGSNTVDTGATNETSLQVGQQISTEGIITANGDYINYTHQLITKSNGIFGLKSKTINLNQYTGDITLEGTVEKNSNGMYIIEVISVIGNSSTNETGITATPEIIPSGVFLTKAGLYLPENFFSNYSLLNSGENKEIKIKHTIDGKAMKITYFKCKKGDPNEDCSELKKNFANMTEKSIELNDGNKLIKITDIASRFITNDLYGYFINDLSEQQVTDLAQYIIIPNKNYVKSNLLDKISTLCVDGTTILEKADKNSLIIDNEKLVLKLTGKINSGAAECKIALNPSLPNLGEKVSFTYPDATASTTTTTTATTTSNTAGTNLTAASNVKQFPINLEKALTFTSTKGGYAIVYPSSNISYDSNNVQTDLDTKGVNCYTQFNVIKYSDKANIDTTPTVKVYECKIKSTAEVPSTYAQKSLADGRTFLIEAVDPAWVDFANNIVIQ